MKKIILPTDFSESAYNAVKYGAKLFKDVETTFYLLHTYTPAIYQTEYLLHSPGQIGLGDIYRESSQMQLEKLKTKIEKEFDNAKHTFIPHTAFNILVDEIVETIKKEKADLVIMGTQGATGAKEILLGTNTVHVIKKATCPIIAVPSSYTYQDPKEILFPTDYEIDYKEEQVQELLAICKTHRSDIQIIHVSTGHDLTEDQVQNRQTLNHILDRTAHLFHNLPDQDLIEAINSFQSKKSIDLLAMVRNKHTFLERMFVEPVIKKIGFHVSVPFMVIPHFEK